MPATTSRMLALPYEWELPTSPAIADSTKEGERGHGARAGRHVAGQYCSNIAELSHSRIVLNIDGPNRSREKHRATARGNPQARHAVLPGRRAHHQRSRVRPVLQGAC